ncbi:MAG: helix-turn-helix transcriptional regulator [Deltaproteobacteria bacterium]|nr:helix-turn-helix transcriptional regulator [Deltaproteobacteria bacterium]
MKKFGELIRDERRFLKMNQSNLGAGVGVSAAYITQIEKGQKIPSLPVILALARALRVDEKHLLKIALTEKVPEVAERFFVEEARPGAKVRRRKEEVKGPQEEMFEMISSDEEVRLEMRKYYEFLKRRLSGKGKVGIYPSKALKEFMEDPRMPKPTDEELRLLMSVNLEYKEPNKWFYKNLLDSYRNNALFARVRRAKAPVKP